MVGEHSLCERIYAAVVIFLLLDLKTLCKGGTGELLYTAGKTSVGLVVKDGDVVFLAVHGEEYLPSLFGPFYGIAVHAFLNKL